MLQWQDLLWNRFVLLQEMFGALIGYWLWYHHEFRFRLTGTLCFKEASLPNFRKDWNKIPKITVLRICYCSPLIWLRFIPVKLQVKKSEKKNQWITKISGIFKGHQLVIITVNVSPLKLFLITLQFSIS